MWWFSDVGVCHQLRAEIELTSILRSDRPSDRRESFSPFFRGETLLPSLLSLGEHKTIKEKDEWIPKTESRADEREAQMLYLKSR